MAGKPEAGSQPRAALRVQPLYAAAGEPGLPADGQLNEPSKNFAPRVGFAYAANAGSTVIRGGYGISYARLPSASVIRLQQRNGTIQKTTYFFGGNPAALAAGPSFPGYLLQAPGLSGGASNVTFADPNLKTPYTEQVDFPIEQKIDNKTRISWCAWFMSIRIR